MIKFLILTALSTVVFWFVWNFMQRTFGPGSTPARRPQSRPERTESKVNWDAETVDYEEIKNPEEKK